MTTTNHNSHSEMGLIDHLRDLRTCLINIIISIVVGALVMFYFTPIFLEFLNRPFINKFGSDVLIGTGPAEALTLKILVAIFSGILLALPYIFYEIWKFLLPAMYDNEKKIAIPFVIITSIFFIAGVSFCYYLVLPIIYDFFLSEYKSINLITQIRLKEQISFTVKILVAFGIIFEVPVLSYFLARLGIITSNLMINYFRYVIVIIFIISAILTPPDVVSQLLMAIPMLFLYGISIVVVGSVEKKKSN